ncbi:MAG: hypothetical protein AAFO69_11955, partial [Bacteroidota bacterium]
MNYQEISINTKQAESVLSELFGIHGTASPLPGEVDFNFRIKLDDHTGYILKISRPDENKDYLEYQQQLLAYLTEHSPQLIAPKVIKDLNGQLIA